MLVTSTIRIVKHFHANISSYVTHDCVIGDFVTFTLGVMCNGNVHVVGHGAVVGMDSVVTNSVLPSVTLVGNPAWPSIKN